MIRRDNTDVEINVAFNRPLLIEYTSWLNERNIKYTFVKSPIWVDIPAAINMRNEDAIIFRLTFGI